MSDRDLVGDFLKDTENLEPILEALADPRPLFEMLREGIKIGLDLRGDLNEEEITQIAKEEFEIRILPPKKFTPDESA